MNTLLINPLLQHQQKLMAIQAKFLRAQFEEIPEQRSKGIDKIDYLMDDLFAIVPHSGAIEDIKHLNEYLVTIDTGAAEYYPEKLQEWELQAGSQLLNHNQLAKFRTDRFGHKVQT